MLLCPIGLVAATLVLTACGERDEPTGVVASPFPVTVEGAGDAPTSLESPPDRIVALDAGSAELIAALGAVDRLVGVPVGVNVDAAETPAQVVDENGTVDIGAVVALEPDLVVVTPETDRVDAAQVERRTRAPVYVQPALTVGDVRRAALDLGFLLGRPVEARRLAGKLEKDVADVERKLADVKPTTAFVDTGLFVTIRDPSLFADLIRRAKGENVATETDAGPLSAEELAGRDPDVYLVTSDSGLTLEDLRRSPQTRDLTAVKDGRVVVLPLDLVTRAGPRVAEALQTIAVALHPDAFK
jgi:ABC-type Fe3+-hydroxamate transport system substrate-binding protein